MDKISGFSDDELLVKILSFLPTKVAVSTSILSKQWKFLWMRVPKLEYDDVSIYTKRIKTQRMLSKDGNSINESLLMSEESQRMQSFINKNLPLHSSPVIESLCLRFSTAPFQPQDVKWWVEIAVSRSLQELNLNYLVPCNALLPSSLYTCKSLFLAGLPSLKTLHLERVVYADEESLQRLLSNCSVLEDLVLKRCAYQNVKKVVVIIPSLLSLSLEISKFAPEAYVIDTPSLKYFKATHRDTPSCLIVNMPKLEEVEITTGLSSGIKNLLEHVISAKRLSLCIIDQSAEAVYGDGIVFKELEHLKFCIVNAYRWSKLLLWLLKASPKLRDLEFDWSGDHASVEGKYIATHILRISCQLKTATISIGQGLDPQKKLEMELEVKDCFRASPSCNLVFE
ncbi:hypothetical protein CARUB_v10027921mg [Capsella rubella]|uniref:FBD domain-containing protein n=1 Tax=Capsella rubella TaxID=81985 RepID=R0EZB9_9BRAS|nr:hypothetical protein CARUB_v10027921mg [Capsella rubella]